MLHIDDCVPGTVVQLVKPFKATDDVTLINVNERGIMWSEWDGFTHGVIVDIAATSKMGKLRVPCSLGVMLYDVKTSLLYMHEACPIIADFSPDELTLMCKPMGRGSSFATHT